MPTTTNPRPFSRATAMSRTTQPPRHSFAQVLDCVGRANCTFSRATFFLPTRTPNKLITRTSKWRRVRFTFCRRLNPTYRQTQGREPVHPHRQTLGLWLVHLHRQAHLHP